MTGLNPEFRDAVLAKRLSVAAPRTAPALPRRAKPRHDAADLLAEARKLFAEATRERAEAARVLADAREEAELILARAQDAVALPSLPSVKAILCEVASRHGVTIAAITGRSLRREVVAARHEAIALAHAARPDLSLPALGRLFRRDHTTILSALRKTGRTP